MKSRLLTLIRRTVVYCAVHFIGAFMLPGNGFVQQDTDELLRLFRSPMARERAQAAQLTAHSNARELIPELIRLLQDPNQHVRADAAISLGKMKVKEAIVPLVDALEKHLALYHTDYLQQETKCIANIRDALQAITGKEYGFDFKKWRSYLLTNKSKSK